MRGELCGPAETRETIKLRIEAFPHGLRQQLKATNPQNIRLDFVAFQCLPESAVDLAIGPEIPILKLKVQQRKGLSEGGRLGAVVVEQCPVCIEP